MLPSYNNPQHAAGKSQKAAASVHEPAAICGRSQFTNNSTVINRHQPSQPLASLEFCGFVERFRGALDSPLSP